MQILVAVVLIPVPPALAFDRIYRQVCRVKISDLDYKTYVVRAYSKRLAIIMLRKINIRRFIQ